MSNSVPVDENQDKILFAFDFDHTLVEENSDVSLMNIIPELKLESLERRDYKKIHGGWIPMINHVMRVQAQNGCTRDDVIQTMKGLNLKEPLRISLEKITANQSTDVVVISDANSMTIQTVLSKYDLLKNVTIYTNPASFDDKGILKVLPYHSHCCIRCQWTPNMCKGLIIHGILTAKSYSKVVYIGDGSNDYCAAMHLSSHDNVIARKGYGLEKRVIKNGLPPPQVDVVDFDDMRTADLLINFLPQ